MCRRWGPETAPRSIPLAPRTRSPPMPRTTTSSCRCRRTTPSAPLPSPVAAPWPTARLDVLRCLGTRTKTPNKSLPVAVLRRGPSVAAFFLADRSVDYVSRASAPHQEIPFKVTLASTVAPSHKRFCEARCPNAMSGTGHEDQFPLSTLSVRHRFSEATLAGRHGNGHVAPIGDLPRFDATRLAALHDPGYG